MSDALNNLIFTEVDTAAGKRKIFHRDTKADIAVIAQTFKQKQYDIQYTHGRWLRALYEKFCSLDKRPVIIDAGANIGTSAVYFATEFPNSEIIAIEPEKENCELARKNTQDLNVTVLNGALYSTDGTLFLHDPGRGAWGFVTSEKHSAEAVNAIGAANLTSQIIQDGRTPFIFKIDIEGGENEVFQNGQEWIGQWPYVIIETHDSMMPGRASSLPFLRSHVAHDRDLIIKGENLISVDINVKSIVTK